MIRPANWKYRALSRTSASGNPGKFNARRSRTNASDKTIKRPPIIDKFREKQGIENQPIDNRLSKYHKHEGSCTIYQLAM